MTTPLAIKRMTRERQDLEKENSDYFVHFKDDNLLEFEAYVVGPDDTPYQHKLVKLRFHIPDRYPMYLVLITIRSLLDNEPYKHEPGRDNDPAFNKFVEYSTWRCLLLDYIERETQPAAKEFLQKHVQERGHRIWDEFRRQMDANYRISFHSPYSTSLSPTVPDYSHLIQDLGALTAQARAQAPATSGGIKRPLDEPPPAPTNVQRTSDDPDRQQPKRAKKEKAEEDNDTSHLIDLTFSSSPEPDSGDEVKEVAGPGKSKFAPAKHSTK